MELKPSNERVDLWALGIVAHQLFFGYHPWEYSVNLWDRSKNRRYGDALLQYADRLTVLGAAEDQSVEDLVVSMLHWDPRERVSAERAPLHPSLQRNGSCITTANECRGSKRHRES